MGDFFDPKEEEMESTSQVGLSSQYSPYLNDALSRAQQLSNDPRELPDFDLTVPMSPERAEALANIEATARGGGYLAGDAVGELGRTLRGEYLSPEAIEMATRGAVNRAMPGVNQQFFGQGGGGALRGAAMTEAMGNVMSDYFSGERGRMMQGLQLAPGIERLGYAPDETLMGVGRAYEADDQRQLAEDIYRFEFEQEEPRQRLNEYMASLGNLLPFATRNQVNNWTEYGPSPFDIAMAAGGTIAGIGGPAGFGFWGNPSQVPAPAQSPLPQPVVDPTFAYSDALTAGGYPTMNFWAG